MTGPAWLRWMLAALMIAIAVHHAIRLVASRRRGRPMQYDVDLTHLAMAVAMAMMLLVTLGGRWFQVFALAFAAPAVWFARRGLRLYVLAGVAAAVRHSAQAVGCAAMLYMLLAWSQMRSGAQAVTGMAGMAGMPGSAGAGWPVLAVLLALAMTGVTLWHARQMRAISAGHRNMHAGGTLAPALTSGCRVAMGVTTVYMLAMTL